MFRSIELNSVRYNLKDNIEDYTEQEKVAIKNCFSNLEVKAQGAELSIEETALRVAWHRLLREENFFVVQAKPKKVAAAKTGRKTKAVKELSPTGQASRSARDTIFIAKASVTNRSEATYKSVVHTLKSNQPRLLRKCHSPDIVHLCNWNLLWGPEQQCGCRARHPPSPPGNA